MQGSPFVSAGIHPWYPDKATFEALETVLSKNELVAVGECGLDKLCDTDWDLQLTLFKKQIALAERFKKPLMIHCVRAWSELMDCLKGVRIPVVIHGFNKNSALANQLLQAGYYISVGLNAISSGKEEMIKMLPPEKMFCETDDSDQPVLEVYKGVAGIKEIDLNSFVLQVQKNVSKVFEIE